MNKMLLLLNSIVFPPPPPPPPQFYCFLHTLHNKREEKTILNSFFDHVSRSKEQPRFPSTPCLLPQFQAATPQQLHALVQIIYNVLTENIPVSEEVRAKLRLHEDRCSCQYCSTKCSLQDKETYPCARG